MQAQTPPPPPPVATPPAAPPSGKRVGRRLGGWVRDVVCGFAAYTGARLIWGPPEGAFKNLPRELLTFAVLWVVLQLLLRGWALSRAGKR